MIAIDTNILLRYLLNDDPEQSEIATSLITGKHKVLITDIVLVEAIWTLKGKKYGLDRQKIIEVILALFEEPNIIFENNQTVWKALVDFRNAKTIKSGKKNKTADFPDTLIANKSKTVIEKTNEFNGVYTFDIAALELSNMRLPEQKK